MFFYDTNNIYNMTTLTYQYLYKREHIVADTVDEVNRLAKQPKGRVNKTDELVISPVMLQQEPEEHLLIVVIPLQRLCLSNKTLKLLEPNYKMFSNCNIINSYFVNIKYNYKVYMHTMPDHDFYEISHTDYATNAIRWSIDEMKKVISVEGPCILGFYPRNHLKMNYPWVNELLSTSFRFQSISSYEPNPTTDGTQYYIMNIRETMTKSAVAKK